MFAFSRPRRVTGSLLFSIDRLCLRARAFSLFRAFALDALAVLQDDQRVTTLTAWPQDGFSGIFSPRLSREHPREHFSWFAGPVSPRHPRRRHTEQLSFLASKFVVTDFSWCVCRTFRPKCIRELSWSTSQGCSARATGPWPLSLPASLRVKETSVLRPPVFGFRASNFP